MARSSIGQVTWHVNYNSSQAATLAIDSAHLKASKADDAPIDFQMWAWPNETQQQSHARDLLRTACHSFWRLFLLWESVEWLLYSPDSLLSERKINRAAIVDCLTRAAHSTYWDWADGSRLFFWRWKWWWKSARDGEVLFKLDTPPKWMGTSFPTDTWEHELQLREKEMKLVHRRYVEFGFALTA